MKNKVLIIGAGGVGGYLATNIDDFSDYEILGFIDDDQEKIGNEYYGHIVIGSSKNIHDIIRTKSCSVAICVHNPARKIKIVNSLSNLNIDFPNFISSSAWISKSVVLGKGNIIYPGVSINHTCKIGDFVTINMNGAIGHDCKIESYSSFAPGVNLAGFTEIGKAVDFGIGAATRQFVKVGDNVIVGGQTMIINDIPNGSTVYGVPGIVRN